MRQCSQTMSKRVCVGVRRGEEEHAIGCATTRCCLGRKIDKQCEMPSEGEWIRNDDRRRLYCDTLSECEISVRTRVDDTRMNEIETFATVAHVINLKFDSVFQCIFHIDFFCLLCEFILSLCSCRSAVPTNVHSHTAIN